MTQPPKNPRLSIVTTNEGKYNAAKKYLSKYKIKTVQVEIPLIEIQGEDVLQIALYKSDQAFKKLKLPCVIMDTSYQISALKGFPGPYMHSIMHWFTIDDFQALMREKKDRKITVQNTAVYKDKSTQQVFIRNLTGEILFTPTGEGNFIDQLVTFRKDKKSVAYCENKNIPFIDKDADSSQWEKLGIWLSNKKS